MNVNKIITQKIIDRLQEAERTGEKFYWVKPFAKGCPKSFAVAYDTRDESIVSCEILCYDTYKQF